MSIKEHLTTFIGNHSSVLCRAGSIEICVWPDAKSKDIGIVCTVGMSNRAQNVPQ